MSIEQRRVRQRGFTLMEMLIAVGLCGILMAVCLSLGLFTARSIASMTDSVDLNARSRYAIDRMSKKLRQASTVKSYSPTSVSVIYSGKALSYTYKSGSKTLEENDGGTITTLLEDCDRLSFAYYKRNPISNSFTQFPMLTASNEVKVIHAQWHCSRVRSGRSQGASDMVAARVVIRAK